MQEEKSGRIFFGNRTGRSKTSKWHSSCPWTRAYNLLSGSPFQIEERKPQGAIMARNHFWSGFTLGALAGVGGVLAFKGFSSDTDSRILRLEKSINIGRPVDLVFAAWSNFE